MRKLLSVTTALILLLAATAGAQEKSPGEKAPEEAKPEETLPPPLPPTPVVARDFPNDQGDKVTIAWLASVDSPSTLLPDVPLTATNEPGRDSLSDLLDLDVELSRREWSRRLRTPIQEMLAEPDPVLRETYEGYLAELTRHYLDAPLELATTLPDASAWLPGLARDLGAGPDAAQALTPLARLLRDPKRLKSLMEVRADEYLQAMRTAKPAIQKLEDSDQLIARLRQSPDLAGRIGELVKRSETIVEGAVYKKQYTLVLGHHRLLARQKKALEALRSDRPDLVPLIDAPKRQTVTRYLVERAPSPDGPWQVVGSKPAGASSMTDGGPRSGIERGHRYFFRVTAVGNQGGESRSAVVSAVPTTQWWYTGRTNNFWATGIFIALIVGWIWGAGRRFPKPAVIGIAVVSGLLGIGAWVTYGSPFNWAVLGAFVPPVLASAVAKYGMKAKEIYIRPIAGIQAVEEAIGRATEMGKPILYVPGLSTIDDIATLASLNILGPVAERAAEYDSRIIVPNRDPVVYTIAEEVVKESFLRAGRPDSFRSEDIYFVTGRQFAYAAAVNGLMLREKPATNFFLGMFWAESLLLAETGAMTGAIQIAGTDAVTQLPFFIVACDYTLIGEELYAAGAYMGRDPKLLGGLKGQDSNKALVILALVLAAVGFFVADLGGSRTAFLDFIHHAFRTLFQVKN